MSSSDNKAKKTPKIKNNDKNSKNSKNSKNEETSTNSELSKKYQKMTQLQHVIELPDTYIGSTEVERAQLGIIQTDNDGNKCIKQKDIKIVPGLISIIEEILVNAFDNHNRIKQRSSNGEKKLKKQTYIKININQNKGEISIENDGEGIDVVEHPEYKVYIPQMIFFELLTSGNYDKGEEKTTGGKNGYGAKLTAIFSSISRIETVDKTRKLKYTQESTDNMTKISKPIIEKYNGASFTRITFIPDYKRFKSDGLSDDMVSLIEKRAYDLVACCSGELQIFFNGKELEAKDINDYMSLYIGKDTEKVSKKINERWSVGAALTPGFSFQHVSFANGINTHQGGKHVDYITKQITNKIAKYILKKKRVEVKEQLIKENLMVFVISTIVNPSFSSQTKEALKTTPSKFGSICEIPDAMIVELANKCGVMERTLSLNEYRDKQLLKKTDGKKKTSVLGIEKLYDAGYAGGKNSDKCTLILTEGDSAKATAKAGISVIENGNNLFGIFPLRGKLLNTRGMKDKDICTNAEIAHIKEILALEEGKEYKDTSSLRYGCIMIMTDQDLDGSHIKGLVINFLCRWPSLMKIKGFITSLLTPIVKVIKGKTQNSFYTLQDFEKWVLQNNRSGWTINYYKGLGTSTPKEGKEYFRDFKQVIYQWDDKSEESMDMAFNKKRTDDRKGWLDNYDDAIVLDIKQSSVSFTDFINYDLIHYSNSDNIRSIPAIDGLKPSQRKILYCCNKRNLVKDLRVAQLSGYVSEHGSYHHGEVSLQGTIVGMAQDFCGSNNINLLYPSGQYGTRLLGGKDHGAARYIKTHLMTITSIIYNKLDEPILKYMSDDDGKKVEPRNYMPIIPMGLVNGGDGIGTGWACSVPQYHPLDIVKNIRNLLTGNTCDEMTPWQRGFKGTFKKIGNMSWLCRGCYKLSGDNTLIITELPVGIWTDSYKKLLDYLIIGELKVEKKANGKKQTTKVAGGRGRGNTKKPDQFIQIVKSYEDNTTDTEVMFKVKFEPNMLSSLIGKSDKDGITDLEKQLCLVKKVTYNSLNIYDEKKVMQHYKNIDQIIESFYEVRLKFYAKRKAYWLEKMKEDLYLISVKVNFILDVINKKILVNNVKKTVLLDRLVELDYPKMLDKVLVSLKNLKKRTEEEINSASYDYLVKMPIFNLTQEQIEKLKNDRNKLESECQDLESQSQKDLWITDLNAFENEYKSFMKSYYQQTGLDAKIYDKRFIPMKKTMLTLRNKIDDYDL
jgi:DNA topoisomerase-2